MDLERNSQIIWLLNIIDQISETLDVQTYFIDIFFNLSIVLDFTDHRILFAKLASLWYSLMCAKIV